MQLTSSDILGCQLLESATVQVLTPATMSNGELAMLQGGPLVRHTGILMTSYPGCMASFS